MLQIKPDKDIIFLVIKSSLDKREITERQNPKNLIFYYILYILYFKLY